MYLNPTGARNGVKTKEFLIMMVPNDGLPGVGPNNIRCIVRCVALAQFGHFMMGRARAFGHTIVVSGAYGGDGLPCVVPNEVWEKGLPLPDELYEKWNTGGGWNSAGAEWPFIQKWAIANISKLRSER